MDFHSPGEAVASVIPGRCDSIEPGISRFRVWSFGPSRNDNNDNYACCLTRCCIRAAAITRRPAPATDQQATGAQCKSGA